MQVSSIKHIQIINKMLTPDELKKLNIGSTGVGATDTAVKPTSLLDRIGIAKKEESGIDKMFPQFKGQEIKTKRPEELSTAGSFENKIPSDKFKMDELMSGRASIVKNPVTGKNEITSPDIETFNKAPDVARDVMLKDQFQKTPIAKTLNSPTLSRITGGLVDVTSDLPLKGIARIQAIGKPTYEEAYNSLMESKGDPNNSGFKKFMYQAQDSIPQMLIGLGLNFVPGVGKVLSTGYWTGLSLEGQRREKGVIGETGIGNVAIDVIGDRLLGNMLSGMLKTPKKLLQNSLAAIIKGAGTEGGTEVLQTFLRNANDYQSARTKEEKDQILANTKNYITSGDMAIEFGVGGLGGGLAVGGGIAAQKIQQRAIVKNIEENYIDRHISEALDVVNETPEAVKADTKGFIEQTKKNIVDGLRADGYGTQADEINSVDITNIKTVEQLNDQVKAKVEEAAKIELGVGDVSTIIGKTKEKIGEKVTSTIRTQREKSIDSLEQDYSKWVGETKTGKKIITKAERRTEALNRAGTEGRTPQRTLAEFGVIPQTLGTKFDTIEQAERFRQSSRPLLDAEEQALQEIRWQTPPISVDELITKAIQKAKATYDTPGNIEGQIGDIIQEMEALRRKYGDTIDIMDLWSEKSKYFKTVPFEQTTLKPFKRTSNYNIASTMQKTIEEIAKKAGYDDVAQLNREIGDIMQAATFLERLSGQSLKYGRIGKYMFMGVGAALGRTAVGKIFGALSGEFVANMLMQADVATPVKRLLLRNLQKTNPQAYEDTLAWIKKEGLERELRLLLPSYPLGSSRNPIITPPPADTSGIRIVEAQSQVIRDPKTGKFKKVFTSEEKTQSQPNALDINTAIKKQTNVSNIDDNNSTEEDMTLTQEIIRYFRNLEIGMSIKDVSGGEAGYKDIGPLTTKILSKLEGRTTVSKQFISDMTNSGDLKQVERDLIRNVLSTYKTGNTPNTGKVGEILNKDTLKVGDLVVAEPKNKNNPTRIGIVDEIKYDIHTDKAGHSIGPRFAMEQTENPLFGRFMAFDHFETIKRIQPTEDIINQINESIDEMNAGKRDMFPDTKKIREHYTIGTSDKINVTEFASKVKQELLPLKRTDASRPEMGIRKGGYQYESITLPEEIRGNVANYSEHIYNSPIKTSAADTHFSGVKPSMKEGYFGHTRVEDMATEKLSKADAEQLAIMRSDPEGAKMANKMFKQDKTRRVIEVQSDLYQKGGIEKAKQQAKQLSDAEFDKAMIEAKKKGMSIDEYMDSKVKPLEQYNDPTAHFRMVREEIKQAAIDGKTKLQFPTGETAMKIEGLGSSSKWFDGPAGDLDTIGDIPLRKDQLEVGKIINEADINGEGQDWIITDVLGDGKFKAVTKTVLEDHMDDMGTKSVSEAIENIKSGEFREAETFDISGKVDTQNPIYKFYESTLGKYLTNNFKAKLITDAQGVTWFEVDITPEMAKKPVMAFGKTTPAGMIAGTVLSAGLMAMLYAFDNPEEPEPEMTEEEKAMKEKLGYTKVDDGELEGIREDIKMSKRIRAGFIQSENRGARDRGENLYESVNPDTGDIGKYQVDPATLKKWSKPWLGKTYTDEEFKKDPDAQERFMDEFEAVVRRYKLSPEEMAVAWHKGWGAIGFSNMTFEEKKKDLMDSIEEHKGEAKEYIRQFLIGYNS